jgi:hypothetical protein
MLQLDVVEPGAGVAVAAVEARADLATVAARPAAFVNAAPPGAP